MENNQELYAFATQLHQEVNSAVEVEQIQQAEAFTQHIIDILIEVGELEDGTYCDHEARGIKVSGYGLSSDGTLSLFTIIRKQAEPPEAVGKSEVEVAFKRLNTFLQKVFTDSYYTVLEESTDAFDMTEHIFTSRDTIHKIRLYLFTDGLTTVDKISDTTFNTWPISYHVWDIRRLYQATASGKLHEPIHIDLIEQFGKPLPCLEGTDGTSDYSAYLTIIPGDILKSLYELYGPRLLELNVRSYLQAKGKVNKGIRQTILKETDRFLAYNNGISATASHIELIRLEDGGLGIKSLDDLQIVNGGQTTASIYHTALKDKVDVSRLRVQAKISVIAPEQVASLVPLISRYANTQNKVNEADFSANDSFHVKLETLSRSIWAPAASGTQQQTQWFYERARGQYQDAFHREGTPARQREFKERHPKIQMFTRTDLAKFEMTWEQYPHIVSLGAQKCFTQFNLLLQKKEQFDADQYDFQHIVAKAILFRRAEAIVSLQNFGGYRANIVAYTLAYINHHTARRIDLDGIWQQQKLGKGLCEAIERISHKIHEIIISPPGSKNVTEWCKRQECWDKIRMLQIDLPASLQKELVSASSENDAISHGNVAGITHEEQQQLMLQVARISPDTWFQLAVWAKETHNLDANKRRLASSLGQACQKGNLLPIKQVAQALQVLRDAHRLGFKSEAVENSAD